jgi:ABC-type nitrate/sulfonate/bicarbonate transport system substrate-binding protein
MTKKTLYGIVAAIVLPLLLPACDKAPQPPMVFGASAWPAYEPVYLAREQGQFQGINLRLDEYNDPAAVEQAFRNHKIQLAALTLDRALLLRLDIPELKIVLLFDTETPATPVSSQRTESARRMDVLIMRDEDIGQYHQEMRQFLQGWRRALDYMHSDPDKAVSIMARHEHVTPAQFNRALQGFELYDLQRNQQLMIGEPPPIGGAIEVAQRALLNQGKLNIGLEPSMLLDSTLLAESSK